MRGRVGRADLFGEDSGDAMQAIRLPQDASWNLSETMVHERDAFGFYFAAHPITQFQAVTTSHGVQTYAALCAGVTPFRRGSGNPQKWQL